MSIRSLTFAYAISCLTTFGCSDSSSATIDAAAADARVVDGAVTDAPGPAFSFEATNFVNGTFTQAQTFNGFGCTGDNASPALQWANPPAGTKSFALTVFDLDAPTGSGFWHWTLFDIPATTASLAANAAATTGGSLPAGAIQGYTDFGRPGYGGPCPPVGDAPHRYVFKLSALSVDKLGLDSTATGALVTFSALGATLGTATFTVSFGINTPHPEVPTPTGFTLASNDLADGKFANNQVLNSFGCAGDNVSPELHWSGAPDGTKSFVLTMFDPDAPTGSGFWHWLAFDIPVTTGSLDKGAGLKNASLGGGIQGYNDTATNGYSGPCPPMGDAPHHYIFTLYALPVATLGVPAGTPGGLLGFNARAQATAKATFTATYGR